MGRGPQLGSGTFRVSIGKSAFYVLKRPMDRMEESVNGLRIIRASRIPIDDKSEENPAAVEEHAARDGARVESRNIRVAAFCVGAHAKRQRHQIDEIA